MPTWTEIFIKLFPHPLKTHTDAHLQNEEEKDFKKHTHSNTKTFNMKCKMAEHSKFKDTVILMAWSGLKIILQQKRSKAAGRKHIGYADLLEIHQNKQQPQNNTK